jgi:large subunit ribosomal protein L22
MMVGEALNLLELNINKKVATDIAKLLKSAVANMQSKNAETSVEVDTLRIEEIRVDEGPVLKRFRARAQGRASQILKRMCHVTVKVAN